METAKQGLPYWRGRYPSRDWGPAVPDCTSRASLASTLFGRNYEPLRCHFDPLAERMRNTGGDKGRSKLLRPWEERGNVGKPWPRHLPYRTTSTGVWK